MSYKAISLVIFLAIIIPLGIYWQIPSEDSFYVLVIDQRGIKAEVAANVAQIALNEHEISQIYWILSNNDTTYFRLVTSLNKPEDCGVTMVNSLGAGVKMAYETLFANYSRQKKVLLYMPSAEPTAWDEQEINNLPHHGVIIYELNFQGQEQRVPGT